MVTNILILIIAILGCCISSFFGCLIGISSNTSTVEKVLDEKIEELREDVVLFGVRHE